MSNVAEFPLLSLILFTPLVGAVVLLFVNHQSTDKIRWIANIVAGIGFLVSLPLWFWYEPRGTQWQFVERLSWIPSIGADYFLGVDGFSALLVLLAAAGSAAAEREAPAPPLAVWDLAASAVGRVMSRFGGAPAFWGNRPR